MKSTAPRLFPPRAERRGCRTLYTLYFIPYPVPGARGAAALFLRASQGFSVDGQTFQLNCKFNQMIRML